MKNLITCIVCLVLFACAEETPPPTVDPDVVRATSYIEISHRVNSEVEAEFEHNKVFAAAWNDMPVQQDITVTNNVATIMTLDEYIQPGPINPNEQTALVDFGDISVATLFDNDIRHCPSNLFSKCTVAGFRMYMLNQNGLVHTEVSEDVVPIYVSDVNGIQVQLPLGSPGIVMQTYDIPAFTYNVGLGDFSPIPSFNIQADFSNAGAGTFTGVVVVEYWLGP